jgi:hypothetical protein
MTRPSSCAPTPVTLAAAKKRKDHCFIENLQRLTPTTQDSLLVLTPGANFTKCQQLSAPSKAMASVDNLTMPNHSSTHHRETLRKTPSLFFALVGFFVFLALIPTLWPELDLQAAALFTGDAPKIAVKHWWWVETINR